MAKFPEYMHFRIKTNGFEISVEDANDIEFAPVRHGRWIQKEKCYPEIEKQMDFRFECSECGFSDIHNATLDVPYCWHCGAKMDARQPYEPATLTVIPAEEMTEQDKAVKAEALKTADNEKGV